MDIEPQGINFEELGIRPDFLEINNIDPSYFNALPEDQKMDIILQFLPKDDNPVVPSTSNLDMDNLAFINSLPPNLREEALLTSDEVFL